MSHPKNKTEPRKAPEASLQIVLTGPRHVVAAALADITRPDLACQVQNAKIPAA